ncbi:DUF433 domain-containing protein [Pseudorhizobium endolithicum]|uniref:DUF433 domain-containing protein n=1 Tax=Pseudorhizobium endolithicum TaxID=1191678 RepID=UPI0038B5038A
MEYANLAGATVEEVLRDYPSLKEQQVVAARAYAEAHSKAGRPYPKQTAKPPCPQPILARWMTEIEHLLDNVLRSTRAARDLVAFPTS